MSLLVEKFDIVEGNPIGKYLVRVWGSGFSVPRSLPGPGDAEETMRVYVNGVLSPLVEVHTLNSLQFLMPTYIGDPTLLPLQADVRFDIVDPVTGAVLETLTKARAFKLRLTPLTSDSRLLAVTKEIVSQFMRHVLRNTVLLTDTDYATEASGVVSVELANQELPILILDGPDPEPDPDYREGQGQLREQGEQWTRTSVPLYQALVFGLTGTANNKGEAINLIALVDRYFSSVQEFNLWYGGLQESLIIELTSAPAFVKPEASGNNLVNFNAQFRVRGFEARDDDRVAAARGWTVLDDELTEERIP